MTGTDWLTAVGILLSGAVIGFMFLYVTTKKKSGPAAEGADVTPSRSLVVRDLEARRDVLIAQLVGTMAAPMTGLVTVLQGTVSGFVRALNQVAEQRAAAGEA